MAALIASWTRDCAALAPGASPHAVQAVGADLLRRWTSPARHYHTTVHLEEVFEALAELDRAGEVRDRESALARVAGWYHDAVYDPAAAPGVNECESAALAAVTLPALSVRPEDAATVDRLVRLTTDHATAEGTAVERAFQDADLWILAAGSVRFDQYCAQVRQEHAHVPQRAYRAGRTAVLQPLLDRVAVYATAHGRRHWEAAARSNLARELSRLG